MAGLNIRIDKIIENIETLDAFHKKHGKEWTLVVKVLGGNRKVLEHIIGSDAVKGTHSIGESRITGLRTIKNIDRDARTMYLKPPAQAHVRSIVRYADISLNSSYRTIKALNEEAGHQGKVHEVIIMIEMGELREGIMRRDVVKFYEKVFNKPNVNIIGIGTNLGCMYGVEPTYDKLIQLCLYKQLIEEKFGQKLPIVSGGSSITLPLIDDGKVPKEVNHMRVGEAAFLGTTPLTNDRFGNLSTEGFEFCADIVELERKENAPDGVICEGNVGHANPVNGDSALSHKALLDFGIVDVDTESITPIEPNARFVGTTSDLTVYDLGSNPKGHTTGSRLHFRPDYIAVARLMNSKYMDRNILTQS